MHARGLAALTAVVALGALAVPAGSAQVRTVGADLNRPANAAYGCETLPTTDFAGNRLFFVRGTTSCTYLATGGLGGSAEVTQAPSGGGIVTAIRVKAGPVVGPMQVTVMRATRSAVGFACCFFAGASQVFTPAANTVTQVPVRLPVRSDFNAEFGETVDYLGLTVLAPGVPIPANELGNPGNLALPGALGFFPHVGPGDAVSGRVDGAGIGGVVPLLAADIVPFCGAGAAAAVAGPDARAAQTAPCLPLLGLGRTRVAVRNGRTTIALVCNAPTDCAGTVRIQRRRNGGAVLASAPISLAASGSGEVKPRLTKAGRKRMKGRRRARAWLVVELNGSVLATQRVTLRRP